MSKNVLVTIFGVLVLAGLVAYAFYYGPYYRDDWNGNNNNTYIPNNNQKEANIVVNEEVGQVFVVSGKARVFENSLIVRVKVDAKTVYEEPVMADAPDVGTFGDFSHEVRLPFDKVRGESYIMLEAFQYSAKDGSEIDKFTVPLNLDLTGISTSKIKIYFVNPELGSEMDCDKVFWVEREILKTEAIGRAALEELLRGPTLQERQRGFSTSSNSGVRVQNLIIKDGVARVDFNEQIDFQIGGSCLVTSIRSQVEETLKQFSTIKEVVISVNGRVDDVLQP